MNIVAFDQENNWFCWCLCYPWEGVLRWYVLLHWFFSFHAAWTRSSVWVGLIIRTSSIDFKALLRCDSSIQYFLILIDVYTYEQAMAFIEQKFPPTISLAGGLYATTPNSYKPNPHVSSLSPKFLYDIARKDSIHVPWIIRQNIDGSSNTLTITQSYHYLSCPRHGLNRCLPSPSVSFQLKQRTQWDPRFSPNTK